MKDSQQYINCTGSLKMAKASHFEDTKQSATSQVQSNSESTVWRNSSKKRNVLLLSLLLPNLFYHLY